MVTIGVPPVPNGIYNSRRPRNIHPRAGVFFHAIEPPGIPSHMKFLNEVGLFKDKHPPVLTFFASFDNRGLLPRTRKEFRDCNVMYYVEDGSIKVYEPLQRNSGIEQGCIINRSMIPKQDGSFYTLDDLNVGDTLIMFGKSFKLLDCDKFTRNFLREMGYRVNQPQPKAVDTVYADRLEEDKPRTDIQKQIRKSHKVQRFLKTFPKTLHFYCLYKRSPCHLEDVRYGSLYYNLSDGTIKILEDRKMQVYQKLLLNGYFDSYLILKPTLVPKVTKPTVVGHLSDDRIILNLRGKTKHDRVGDLLMGRQTQGGSQNALLDSNPVEAYPSPDDFYSPKDLSLDIEIDVFGAKVYLYDCDEFTKQFYRHEFQRELIPVKLPDPSLEKQHKLVYPQQVGAGEDSLFSCWNMESLNKSKKFIDMYHLSKRVNDQGNRAKSVLKFYLNCRNGLDGKVLRFLARLLTDDNIRRRAIFLIAFHLEDDTIEIVEFKPESTKDMRLGSIFFNRRKVVKPTVRPLNSKNCFYTMKDFAIGKTICVSTEKFYLFDADEYAFEFMENNPDVFPDSNIPKVLNKFRVLLRSHATSLKDEFERINISGVVNDSDFKNVVFQNLPDEPSSRLSEQELVTLARFFAEEEYTGFEFYDLVSKVQTELKREKFQDFDKLKNQFELFDLIHGNRNGFFKTTDVYSVLLSSPVPINKDLLKFFLFKFPKHDGLINYQEVLKCVDYLNFPAKLSDHVPYAINLNWRGVEKMKNMEKINYNTMLQSLTCEKCPECEF